MKLGATIVVVIKGETFQEGVDNLMRLTLKMQLEATVDSVVIVDGPEEISEGSAEQIDMIEQMSKEQKDGK